MNRRLQIVCMICFSGLLIRCVEPYSPDIKGYESLYVVDAQLSNLSGPHEVRVSRSYEYETEEPVMVSGAQVTIKDNLDNKETLTEVEKGVYHTSENFQGQPGRQYQLRIEMDTHTVLESDFETLKAPVEIDSVYWEYEDRTHAGVDGIQLYLDARNVHDDAEYFAWEYEEYWEFDVPLNADPDSFPDERTCWDSSMYHNYILTTTTGQQVNALIRKSLYFIDNTTNRIEKRYTTLVKQHVLTEKAYTYYSRLQNLNENTGTLFDPAPYTLEGNITNLGDPDQPVLGIFQVSGISQTRIYISVSDITTDFFAEGELSRNCTSIETTEKGRKDTLVENGYFLYNKIGGGRYTIFFLTTRRECFLCSLTGSQEPPAFWKDK